MIVDLQKIFPNYETTDNKDINTILTEQIVNYKSFFKKYKTFDDDKSQYAFSCLLEFIKL